MDIRYDGEQFTFSYVTVEEFIAIRELLKLGRLAAKEHKFTHDVCNTADKAVTELGCKLTEQIKDAFIGVF